MDSQIVKVHMKRLDPFLGLLGISFKQISSTQYYMAQQHISLGKTDLKVGQLGLGNLIFFTPDFISGCMGMSDFYDLASRNEEESLQVIEQSIKNGINLFNTADFYGPFTNEILLGTTRSKII